MTHAYLTLDPPHSNIFAEAEVAEIGGAQVSPAILDAWPDSDLAQIGVARAAMVVPDYDRTTHTTTGLYDPVAIEDGWQWQARIRPLTEQEILAAAAAEHEGVLAARTAARVEIDAAAEMARGRWLTLGAGQAMVYQQKEKEAAAVRAAIAAGTTITPADYPHLVAEIGITSESIAGVADVVLAMAAQWLAVSAQIEKLRLSAKAAISIAANVVEIDAAKAVSWPKPEDIA